MTKSKTPTAHRRYLTQLDRLETALRTVFLHRATSPRSRPGRLLYEADGRTPLFYLEGLARIGRHIGPKRRIADGWLAQFKEIEDRLGAYDYWADLRKRGEQWKLPAALLAYFDEHAWLALGALDDRLAASGWYVEGDGGTVEFPTIDALRAEVAGLDWPSPRKERKELAGFLRDQVLHIRAHLNDGTIDLNRTETGIHELRRNLRWLPIYALATTGKIALDTPEPAAPLGRFITPDAVSHRFNQLPVDPDETEHVRYHAGGFYACSALIADIGAIKDRALWTDEITRSSAHAGVPVDVALNALGTAQLPHEQAVARVRELVEDVIARETLLERMAEHLDAQT